MLTSVYSVTFTLSSFDELLRQRTIAKNAISYID